MSPQRVWFSEWSATFLAVTLPSLRDVVTGASSGFGLSLTTHVLEQGDIVIATVRKPETLQQLLQTWTQGQLLVLKVDVSSPDDIKDAFRTAEIRFGRIDVVYNNAGFSVMGELESTPEEEARKMFDVNVWGAINVAREAVRFFRDVNKPQGGRLWSVTSAAGLLPIPAFGYYCASKFGALGGMFLEGLMVTSLSSPRRCHLDIGNRSRSKVEHQCGHLPGIHGYRKSHSDT